MPKLIPPDPKRCQTVEKKGAWPDAEHFMVIGPRQLVRCQNKPTAIIKEQKKGKDGKRGSMSVCSACLALATKTFGKDYFTIEKL